MKRVLDAISREPAMLAALFLAILNIFTTINADQAVHIETIVESIVLLLTGGVVRQSVYSPATVDDIRKGLKP